MDIAAMSCDIGALALDRRSKPEAQHLVAALGPRTPDPVAARIAIAAAVTNRFISMPYSVA
jgi:hypothetical protein